MKRNSLRVTLNLFELSIPEKIQKSRQVLNAIVTNNTVFPDPSPEPDELDAVIRRLEEAHSQSIGSGWGKTPEMHDLESELLALMRRLSHYVELTARGREDLVRLACLDFRKLNFW